METSEIIEKIKVGLKACSQKHNIPARDVKIKISKKVEKGFLGKEKVVIGTDLMNASEVVEKISIKDLFGVSVLVEPLVTGFLEKSLNTLATKNNIDNNLVNARIFSKSEDFSPSVYLYNGDKAFKEISVAELTA